MLVVGITIMESLQIHYICSVNALFSICCCVDIIAEECLRNTIKTIRHVLCAII